MHFFHHYFDIFNRIINRRIEKIIGRGIIKIIVSCRSNEVRVTVRRQVNGEFQSVIIAAVDVTDLFGGFVSAN